MKACVLHQVGDLRFEEVDTPVAKAGEVLVKVGACGVCGSDIPRVFTKGTYSFPTIPGHEFAGTVTDVGADIDGAWRGKRVAVFPLIPCRQCGPCEIGAYAMCENYNYLGSRCDGAFAEYVTAPVWNLVPLPDGVSMEEGAMTEPAAVAAHALRRAAIDVGDNVLIFGAGPIGVMVAMWARIWGAGKVLLADIDPAKLDFAKDLGFTDTVNARENDSVTWTMDQTGRGADVVVEASGSSIAYEQSLKAARTFGRVVLLGNPAGEMTLSQSGYWAALRKELTLHGSWNSTYSNLPKNEWTLVLEFMASGALDVKPLITHPLGLDELWEGLKKMHERSTFINKMMYLAR